MIQDFTYLKPGTVKEALAMLADHGMIAKLSVAVNRCSSRCGRGCWLWST